MKTLKVCVVFLILFILIFSLSWSKSKRIEKIGRSHIFSEKTKLQRPIYKGFSNPFLFSQGGPNGYGYTWLDSDDPGGPTYSWIEISTIGTSISSGEWYTRSGTKYDSLDDGTAGPFPIGFDFVYNGQTFDSVYIGTNGAISFTHDTLTDGGYFYNAWIPGMRFSDVLAPFWNDLNLSSPYGGGYVYYWTNSTDSFVVQYDDVKPWVQSYTSDKVTFELILCKSDYSITFQYKNVTTPTSGVALDSSALIGIQDQTKYCGLRYYGMGFEGYDNIPDSGLAIKFKRTQDVTHNLLPGKIITPFDFPYYYYYDEPPFFLWYVGETGTSFTDNWVKVINTGGFTENDIPVWSEISRKDSLGNYIPLYTVGKLVSSLSSMDTSLVAFPTSWIPMDRGKYYVTYRTELSGDEVLSDDTLRGILFAERNLLHSAWADTVPIFDGIINPSEWSDANKYDISKFYLNPRVVDCDKCYDSNAVWVYIKNDSVNLYFGFEIPKDTSDTSDDMLIIGIDDNADGFFDSDSSEGRYSVYNVPGDVRDTLFFIPFLSDPADPYYSAYGRYGIGAKFSDWPAWIKNNSGYQQAEISIPFSTDPKYFLNSSAGDTISAFLSYIDEKDTCIVGSQPITNSVAYWPFQAIFDFYPTLLGRIYLSDAPSVPDKPILVFPPNETEGAVDQAFLWEPALRATSYQLQIDYDSTFANSLIIDTTVTNNGCFVTGLPDDTLLWWRVRGINSYGEGPWSDSAKYTDIEFPTDETDDLIAKFSLSQNYPNPFNPATTIPFTVYGSRKTVNSPVHTTQKSVYGSQFTVNSPIHTTLTIYNILGQRVRTLMDDVKLPGEHKIIWDGKDDKGNSVSSGIYFYRLKAGEFVQVKKMLLIK